MQPSNSRQLKLQVEMCMCCVCVCVCEQWLYALVVVYMCVRVGSTRCTYVCEGAVYRCTYVCEGVVYLMYLLSTGPREQASHLTASESYTW